MFLSASINLFDGEELLEPLLQILRSELDHVSVLYQTVSYWGNPASSRLLPVLQRLQQQQWIDTIVPYDSCDLTIPPKQHETLKRQQGLTLAREAGATHFLSLDVDEFYRVEDLHRAKRFLSDYAYDATACRVQDYHSRPTYRCLDLATYHGMDLYVPFICRTDEHVAFAYGGEFFCCVDPSRRVVYRKPYVFTPQEFVMHHMTTVRGTKQSMLAKFINSSSRPMFPLESPEDLTNLIWEFDPNQYAAPRVAMVPDEFRLSGLRAA